MVGAFVERDGMKQKGDKACRSNPMNTPFNLILYEISIRAIPAVIAITFHEASHGYVAHLLGDDTAWLESVSTRWSTLIQSERSYVVAGRGRRANR
jgi:hypothetical protein